MSTLKVRGTGWAELAKERLSSDKRQVKKRNEFISMDG
jgi:hypothetical protein